jgi:hypothetical protein
MKEKLPGYKSGSDDDDDDCIGPMPYAGNEEDFADTAAIEVERRAQKMKSRMLGEVL